METYIKAKLVSWRRVNVIVFTDIPRPNSLKVFLYKNNKLVKTDNISKLNSINIVYFFDVALNEDYELGASYYLLVDSFPKILIDISGVVNFADFDERFAYNGDDLGAVYQKDSTSFAVWAPLAESVFLKLVSLKNETKIVEMTRSDKGVYRAKINGDLLNYKYHYIVNNNGAINETNDPYAKGTSLNSEYSVVIDYDELLNKPKIAPKNKVENYVDALIYETHIRDMNEGNNNNVVNKGKYLGFVEENRKTAGGHPAGLDYLKNLGITHVQLNPVIDFGTVDDVDMNKKYNWGYDPISMFALEGSYSLRPDIPQERLVEYRTMINKLHKADIRVIMDVVYNHTYEYLLKRPSSRTSASQSVR